MQIIDFSVARFKHLNWVFRIRCFLDKKEMLTLEQAISHKHCDLGLWLHSKEVQEKYKIVPEFMELDTVHQNLHSLVKQIIELKEDEQEKQAEEKYKELKPISNKIITLLTNIEKMIKKPS